MPTRQTGFGFGLVWTLVLVVAMSSAAGIAGAQSARHVVLVSVDGFRPDFYLDEGWPAPNIQQMARAGVHAERVRSVFPSVTYPSHTTIITGALPARHGIFYNQPFEDGGQTGRWYWEEKAILVDTLWDSLRKHGLETAAVSWPVTVGAPIDRVVPEVWALEGDDRFAPMREGTTAGLWQELEQEATGRLGRRNFSADYNTRDDTTGAAAAYILESHKPSLISLHLIASDHFQHEAGRDSPVAKRAIGAADRAIGAVRDAAERAGILEDTAFIVTGDHGFVNVQTAVAPNVWLARAGLHGTEDDRGEWRASFHTAGGGALLRLRDPGDDGAVADVRRVLADLPTPTRRLFRVVDRTELDAIGADPNAPLALSAALGVSFSASAQGDAVRPGRGGTHGYFPSDFPEIYTGFVGWGAGFQSGLVVHEMGLEDIAGLIGRLLGVEHKSLDGSPPWGVLTE